MQMRRTNGEIGEAHLIEEREKVKRELVRALEGHKGTKKKKNHLAL